MMISYAQLCINGVKCQSDNIYYVNLAMITKRKHTKLAQAEGGGYEGTGPSPVSVLPTLIRRFNFKTEVSQSNITPPFQILIGKSARGWTLTHKLMGNYPFLISCDSKESL